MTDPTTRSEEPFFSFMIEDDFSIAVELGAWVAPMALLLACMVLIWLWVRGRVGFGNFELDSAAIGIGDTTANFKPIQSLINHIKVTPTNTGFDVELHGELGAIMEIVDENEQRPAGVSAGRCSLSVVAGVGFEPTTFRL